MSDKKTELVELEARLVPWLQTKMPAASNLAVVDLDKPGMGLSSETYLFNTRWEEAGQAKSAGMVLRSAPPGGKVFPDYELGHQFHIMRALEDSAVPVAKMLWLEEDPAVIGVPFFVMDRLYGEVPQDFPSYHGSGMFCDTTSEMRAKMWWGSLEAMAEIHKLDWKARGLSFLGVPGSGTGPIDRQLDYWDKYFEWVKEDPAESHPTLEASVAWMKENRYEPERVALCWGDARMGNTLYSAPERDVLAVMDWEMAFIGDPIADLAWYILLDWQHSVGAGLARCEGTPSYEETIERYQEITGWKANNLLFNEVFCAVRYGMILVAVFKKFSQQGIPIDADMIHNNVCTQRLSELLDLPSPGPKKQETARLDEATVTLQFHFTGPDAADWYIVSEKGEASRHDGTVDDPTCTITVLAADWAAVRSGELDRMEAWSTGRMVIDGDLNVMMQLEETISRLAG